MALCQQTRKSGKNKHRVTCFDHSQSRWLFKSLLIGCVEKLSEIMGSPTLVWIAQRFIGLSDRAALLRQHVNLPEPPRCARHNSRASKPPRLMQPSSINQTGKLLPRQLAQLVSALDNQQRSVLIIV
jgi:hypothetical protein